MPLLGMWMGGLLGLIIGICLAFICHKLVRPYMGFNLIRIKPIGSESEFVELKHWMVPNGNKDISKLDYEYIESDASVQAKSALKDIARTNGSVTYYDLVNYCLLDEQLWNRISGVERSRAAAKAFADD